MSKRHSSCKCSCQETQCCENIPNCGCGNGLFGNGSSCCSFPTLIILILIVLQFNRRKGLGFDCEDNCDEEEGRRPLIDNSLLFIIALFFLSCCNPCRGY